MHPIWAEREAAGVGDAAEITALAQMEAAAPGPLRAAVSSAARRNLDTEAIVPIVTSAETDLTAGCALARLGYLKQAYALWRSWYEQALFALYFLESPLHRSAWRVVDAITPGDRPPTELMLHQLLDASKKHPFQVVYSERFDAIYAGLKRAAPAKADAPFKVAERCLTDLSQGVHGTFNPLPPKAASELPGVLERHALPVLKRTDGVVSAFCFAFVHALVSPSEQQLLEMRRPDFVPTEADDSMLVEAFPALDRWLASIGDPKAKERNRG